MDDILEDEECFQVTLTIPMNLSFVAPGPITETTVCIRDIAGVSLFVYNILAFLTSNNALSSSSSNSSICILICFYSDYCININHMYVYIIF